MRSFAIVILHKGKNIEMKAFWDSVVKKTKNTLQINSNELLDIFRIQEDEITNFLIFTCYLDNSVDDDEINRIKSEIVYLYSNSISKSISKIEVYSHDLPPEIVEALFELLQSIIAANSTQSVEDKKTAFTETCNFAYFIKHLTEIILGDYYLERIKQYRKQLRNFSIKGVKMDDGSAFWRFANKEYTRLRKEYKFFKKTINTYLMKDEKGIPIKIKYSEIKRDIKLEEHILDLENLIREYEKAYPKIIHSGYNQPKWYRIMTNAILFLTAIVTAISLLKIFGIIDLFAIIKTCFAVGA